ncbi:MAG: UDP-N-acetylmuramoyl-tripeptide--D-alanyl-D-alanine ligase [Marinilabiliaceae bacterium]|nr:UDP-N-acetylmuramoyl-tripeptide--D-alanyl-D-alanine ligase [Marinilabiliaceae bacterium]
MEAVLEQIYDLYLRHSVISTDSRKCPVGAIYFALKGERFDGNKFVLDVLNRGASRAVSDDKSLIGIDNVIIVSDVLKTLQNLALFHRRKLGIPILGITGTNGKTTTKELVATVLQKKFKVEATKGNLNNHIGVPLTILSMDQNVEFGVVEMGANHIGEIDFLCRIAEPDFGVITNVGKAHLEGFGSFEGVKRAKGELYNFLREKSALAFINADNVQLEQMGEGLSNKFEYGIEKGVLKGCVRDVNNPFLSVNWGSESMGCKNSLETHLIGAYNLENVLCAIAVGTYFGISSQDINDAISSYYPTNNRSQFIKTATNKIILDAYNANPSSMVEALNNFTNMDHISKVAILGGMKELGEDSVLEHEKLIEHISGLSISTLILVGDEFADFTISTVSTLKFDSYESVNRFLKKSPLSNSLFLIKGSRSNRLEKIVPFL